MSLKVYINGRLYDKKNAQISVFDHGLLYGDGVFEGIRSYKGCVFKLREHLDRLYESANTICLKIAMSKKAMEKAVISTLKANGLKDAYIRLVVTRGPGDLGLDPRKCHDPSIIIIADKILLYPTQLYRDGMSIVTVPTRRNLQEALNPQVKSLNYLNNILAKIEAINAGFEEAIMLNSEGCVLECTGDNIFMIKDGVLATPPVYMGALKGITRDAVIDIARKKKMRVEERPMTRHELFNAHECFLTGTAAELIPVVRVDGRTVGTGRPGPVTMKLLEGFRSATKTDGVKYKV